MKKRRTKQDKVSAKHQFTLTWDPSKSSPTGTSVKGQFTGSNSESNLKSGHKKSAIGLAKDVGLGSLKKQIVRSLIVSSFILSLELVIYLVTK